MAHGSTLAAIAPSLFRSLFRTWFGVALLAVISCEAVADSAPITLKEWRTEPGKSLVCGNSHEGVIVKIARGANNFYVKGAKANSPEYDAHLDDATRRSKRQALFRHNSHDTSTAPSNLRRISIFGGKR